MLRPLRIYRCSVLPGEGQLYRSSIVLEFLKEIVSHTSSVFSGHGTGFEILFDGSGDRIAQVPVIFVLGSESKGVENRLTGCNKVQQFKYDKAGIQ